MEREEIDTIKKGNGILLNSVVALILSDRGNRRQDINSFAIHSFVDNSFHLPSVSGTTSDGRTGGGSTVVPSVDTFETPSSRSMGFRLPVLVRDRDS